MKDAFFVQKLAQEFCAQHSIEESDPAYAKVISAFSNGYALGSPSSEDLLAAELGERVKGVMSILNVDDKEGAIWTACSLLLISCAFKMKSALTIINQDGVTIANADIGDWQVRVEQVKA